MTKAREAHKLQDAGVWVLLLGAPEKRFIAYCQVGLACFPSRKSANEWAEDNGYLDRRVWRGARIVKLAVALPKLRAKRVRRKKGYGLATPLTTKRVSAEKLWRRARRTK